MWKLDLATGVLSHVAGTGERGFGGDGGPGYNFGVRRGVVAATFEGR